MFVNLTLRSAIPAIMMSCCTARNSSQCVYSLFEQPRLGVDAVIQEADMPDRGIKQDKVFEHRHEACHSPTLCAVFALKGDISASGISMYSRVLAGGD